MLLSLGEPVIRRFVVFAAVASSFACPPPIAERCGDALPPCSAGFVCVAGLCARAESDGGALDASVGSDGGSTDAGRAVGCDGGCAPWAVCVASTTSAACVNGRLEVAEPVDATTLRAGESVAVSARFVLVDGGAWPNTLAIPVQANWGPQTMLLSGIAGSVAGLSDAGQGAVVFGWDGGPVESRAVAFSACAAEVVASCDPFMECAPSSTGGLCVSHGYVVEWVSPDAGSATNQASVPAEIRVSKPDAGVVTLTSIPVTGATAFTGAAGRYTGVLPIPAPDGVKMFTAGWPTDGATSTLSIERDTIAPSISVVVEPRNGPDPDIAAPTAWKKDEKALIKVTVDGGRPAVASDLRPPPNGVVTPEVCGGCTGACRCFGIDVSSTPLNGLRGPMGVQVLPINDPAGNTTEQRDAGFDVTRLRWVRTTTLSSFMNEVHSPAVSETGLVVYAVSARNPGQPTTQAFDPLGNRLWSAVPDIQVTAAPVISGDSVWVALSDGFSVRRMAALSLRDGGVDAVRCVDGGVEFFRSMALASIDGGQFPVGVGDVISLGSTTCPTGFFGAGAATRSAIALREVGRTVELFKASGNRLAKFETQGVGWVDRGIRHENAGLGIQGLALDFSDRLVGGGGAVGPSSGGGTFMVVASDHLDGGWFTPQPPLSFAPILSADQIVGVSTNGNMMRIPYSPAGLPDAGVEGGSAALAGGQKFVLGQSRIIAAGSVFGGAGAMGSSIRVGQIRTSDLSVEWGVELDSAQMTTGQVADPALDVLRTDGGVKDCTRQLGVLYLSTSLGTNAALYSILVDAKGLDPTAPWPKFQRDNANRGNISLPTTPWTCP